MKHEGLYYAKHCATHGDYDDRAQVCPKCVPERGFPSPASPAVGGEEEPHASSHDTKHDTSMMSAEEEAKKYAHQKCEEFLAAHGSLPYGFHGFAKGIYLAGFSRGGEVEREKVKEERRAWHLQAEKDEALFAEKDAEISSLKQEVAGGSWAYVKQIDDLRATLEAVEKERDRWEAEPTRKTFFAMKDERDAMADGLAKIAKMTHEWNCKARCMGRGGIITQVNSCNCHVGIARALLASREEKKE